MKRYKSDSQANAEALARRSTTHAQEHARSWEVRFGGQQGKTMSTQGMVVRLNALYADDVPIKMHYGPGHIDGGGTPAMTPAFIAYIDGAPMSTVEKPDNAAILVGTFRKPQVAAIESMLRCDGKVAWWGAIVRRVVYFGEDPKQAAMNEGSHFHEAARTANEALAEALRRWTPDKMNLRHSPPVDAVA